MTDLEMIKLCAEAMGLTLYYPFGNKSPYFECGPWHFRDTSTDNGAPLRLYAPQDDDAQAMALIKKHSRVGLMGQPKDSKNEAEWYVTDGTYSGCSDNLNRAIVECVAKMQAAKVKA